MIKSERRGMGEPRACECACKNNNALSVPWDATTPTRPVCYKRSVDGDKMYGHQLNKLQVGYGLH